MSCGFRNSVENGMYARSEGSTKVKQNKEHCCRALEEETQMKRKLTEILKEKQWDSINRRL